MQTSFSYAHTESFKSLGGRIVIHEMDSQDIIDKTPILFIPGWGAPPETAWELAIELRKKGRQMIVVDHEHLDVCSKIEDLEYESVPCLEYNKAVGIQTIIKERSFQKVDLISHSEGSVAATITAHMNPSAFRNILLVNPAGLLVKDSLLRLTYRFLLAIYTHIHFSKGKARKHSITIWSNVLWYVLLNPIQSFREAFGLPFCDIRLFLKEAVENNPKRISILQTQRDIVFPYRKVKKTLSKIPELRVYHMNGNHIQLYLEPRKFTRKIIEIFNEVPS